jgi:hypothetical protein
MVSTFRPRGHIQVKMDANGRTRAFWAFWRDQHDQKVDGASAPPTSATPGGGRRVGRSCGQGQATAGREWSPLSDCCHGVATSRHRSPLSPTHSRCVEWLAPCFKTSSRFSRGATSTG